LRGRVPQERLAGSEAPLRASLSGRRPAAARQFQCRFGANG